MVVVGRRRRGKYTNLGLLGSVGFQMARVLVANGRISWRSDNTESVSLHQVGDSFYLTVKDSNGCKTQEVRQEDLRERMSDPSGIKSLVGELLDELQDGA